MTPTAPLYLDYYQSRDTQNEPLAIGGYNPVDMVYNFNPIPESLTEEQAKFILGTQANIWTEYITTPEHLEYMILPRLAALSEVQWDQVENKSYDRFHRGYNRWVHCLVCGVSLLYSLWFHLPSIRL